MIRNTLDRLVSEVGRQLGNNSDITDTLEHMKTRIEDKLIKGLELLLYHDDSIVVRIKASIDWKQNEFQVATVGAHLEGGDQYVTVSTEEFTEVILGKFLQSIARHTHISNVRVVFYLSDEAIAAHGETEARRLANVHAVSEEVRNHLQSFVAVGDDVSFADPGLSELSLGVQFGRSKPLASFARTK